MPVCSWEKTITCPYNISHQITEGRLQVRITMVTIRYLITFLCAETPC